MINVIKFLFIYFLLSSSLIAELSKQNQETKIAIAKTYYSNEEYLKAYEIYEELFNQYESSSSYFNAGNCQYLLGNYGKALFLYSKAIKLSPTNQDLIHNKNQAIEKLEENEIPILKEKADSFLIQDSYFINNYGPYLLIFTYCSFFLLIIVLRKIHNKKLLFLLSIFSLSFLLASAYLALNIFFSRDALGGGRRFVLPGSINKVAFIYKSSNVYAAPDESSQQISVLKSGVQFLAKNKLNNFIMITLPNGRKGWVKMGNIKLL